MVLEHLFPEDWLEKKSRYAFILGAGYSVIGILLGSMLFSDIEPAMVSVAFTSLLILPELYKLFSIEEREEGKERLFSFKELLKDNFPFWKAYTSLFLGMLLVYSLATMLLPALEVSSLFQKQLSFRSGGFVAGNAFSITTFNEILTNNFWVLLACFIISLLTGDGAIFIITWNASLWGTIFGITARNAAFFTQGNQFLYFLTIMVTVMPHVLLEASAYILAAISGGVISKDVLLERFDSDRFWRVFKYNFMLLLVALVFLVAGAVVESWVLSNSQAYLSIIRFSQGLT